MSDLLLAKPQLPADFIDTSVGEAHLVKDTLIEVFDLKDEFKIGYMSPKDLSYPSPNGYLPLVKHLEEQFQAPVIITNGAKQGLGAIFYSLKKLGWNNCREKLPYWALIPPLAHMHGIDMIHSEGVDHDQIPLLLISPNNPNGHCETAKELISLSQEYKKNNIPLIHDAVYYSHIYLPYEHSLPPVGDVQIFSFSKYLGFSGLRLGFVVCHNPILYKLILEYMEAMTVGVSVASQSWLFDLLDRRLKAYPTLTSKFEALCYSRLKDNKKICLNISPEVLEIPKDIEQSNGMFGFFKKGDKFDPEKAKLNFIDGKHFGNDAYVRMNLAFNKEIMSQIVERLNSLTKV